MADQVPPSRGLPPAQAVHPDVFGPAAAASNPYAQQLAAYQQSVGAQTGAQLNRGLQNQQAYQKELTQQQRELKKKNSLWNRIKGAVGNSVVDTVGMALPAGALAAVNGRMASQTPQAGGGGGGANPYAQMMANPQYQNLGQAGNMQLQSGFGAAGEAGGLAEAAGAGISPGMLKLAAL